MHELHAFEALLRESYDRGARVASAFAAAQKAEGLSPVVGHQFVAAISNATHQVSGALGTSADAHRLLERLGTRLGFATTGYGDGRKDPAEEVFTGADARRSSVAA